jgi:hypothetical protein
MESPMREELTAAQEHLARMEDRIRRQREEVERFSRAGEDPSEAAKTLLILNNALDMMISNLARLLPTETSESNRKRSHST